MGCTLCVRTEGRGTSVRICGDYKQTVNRATEVEQYPIPRIEDLFASLTGGESFTKLDLSQANNQIPLDKESKRLTTINTPKGLFEFNRLPFGIASSAAMFQRTMEALLKGIPRVAVFLDDVLITGKTEDKHLQNLEKVLQRLNEAGLKVKPQKCVFNTKSVVYLGHQIDREGLHPTEERLKR